MSENPNPDLAVEVAERMADPRGIRVTLGQGSASAGLPALVLEPPEVPLVPLARVPGRGLLGGTPPIDTSQPGPEGPGFVLANGQPLRVTLVPIDAERAILVRDGGGDDARTATRTAIVLMPPSATSGPARGIVHREVIVDGWRVEVETEPAARAALRDRARRGREEIGQRGPSEVHAIIPGVVVSVSVIAGDEVTAGQQLLVVEAMKMQNELRAPRDGSIERVAVAAGQTIEVGDLLLVLA